MVELLIALLFSVGAMFSHWQIILVLKACAIQNVIGPSADICGGASLGGRLKTLRGPEAHHCSDPGAAVQKAGSDFILFTL